MCDLSWKLVPTSQEDLSRPIKETLVMWEPIQDPRLGRGSPSRRTPVWDVGTLSRRPNNRHTLLQKATTSPVRPSAAAKNALSSASANPPQGL